MSDKSREDRDAKASITGILPVSRRSLLFGTGAAASLAALNGIGITPAHAATSSKLPSHTPWKFVFVNHVTTNPFFVPTQYGIADACDLFNCTWQWTGSQTSVASEMVNAFNAAVAAKADAIAISLVDLHAFTEPVKRAMDAGIPVFSYNADAPQVDRLAYIGQDLYAAGESLGRRIADLVGEGTVAGFIATPGQLNIQPRLDGAKAAIKASGKNITLEEIATGPTVNEEVSRVDSYYVGHKDIKGMFAVDAGSTMAVGATMKKYGLAKQGIHGGGFDLLPNTIARYPRRRSRLHHRPAALSAGLLLGDGDGHVHVFRRPHRPLGDQHRPQVRHQGQCRSLSDDEEPLRRQLVGREGAEPHRPDCGVRR